MSKIAFKKVSIHHFLSFGDAEVQLSGCGYVLVSGINLAPQDAAVSNGSGKSTIWSAICWALTGETIQGLSSNLPNIVFNDGCSVSLEFSVDKDDYKITRYKDAPKIGSDMKIEVNGVDKSGKGIRESEKVLADYLPDLTSSLIGSVIILGQGLPHKFTDNTPSGRKELLEKLSKSDFMIDDIKRRLSARQGVVEGEIRKCEDAELKANAEKSLHGSSLARFEAKLGELLAQDVSALQKAPETLSGEIERLKADSAALKAGLQLAENDAKLAQSELAKLSAEKDAQAEKYRKSHADAQRELFGKKADEAAKATALSAEIARLKAITDVCPTCGQKIPGVMKPDTSAKEKALAEATKAKAAAQAEIDADEAEYSQAVKDLSEGYSAKGEGFRKAAGEADEKTRDLRNAASLKDAEVASKAVALAKAQAAKDGFEAAKKDAEEGAAAEKAAIASLDAKLAENGIAKKDLLDSEDVLGKMSTLVKRDFRGALLSNVISYIDLKAKEYCGYVFDSNDLSVSLDGNNIGISFCGKAYENLSGGEKQKVDVVLQFSLRDMLCKYLDFSSNILVLDEIFDNLDQIGCTKVLNLISQKLTDVESVYIITHHTADLAIPSDSEITVVKDASGVSSIKR